MLLGVESRHSRRLLAWEESDWETCINGLRPFDHLSNTYACDSRWFPSWCTIETNSSVFWRTTITSWTASSGMPLPYRLPLVASLWLTRRAWPTSRGATRFDLLRNISYLDYHDLIYAPISCYRLPPRGHIEKDPRGLYRRLRCAHYRPRPRDSTFVRRHRYLQEQERLSGYPGYQRRLHLLGRPELSTTLEHFKGDEANKWQDGFNVYEPADFFTLYKERYRELSWIGLGPWNMFVMRRKMNWEYESEPDTDSNPEDEQGGLAWWQAGAGLGPGQVWDFTGYECTKIV